MARSSRSPRAPADGSRKLEVDAGHDGYRRRRLHVATDALRGQDLRRRPAKVALTFDDGPGPGVDTADPGHAEAEACAAATFFIIGRQRRRHIRTWCAARSKTDTRSATTPSRIPNVGDMPPAIVAPRDQCHATALRSAHRPLDAPVPAALSGRRDPTHRRAERGPYRAGAVDGISHRRTEGRSGRLEAAAGRSSSSTRLAGVTATDPDTRGQIVLLHDGGGDRTRHVAGASRADRRAARQGLSSS